MQVQTQETRIIIAIEAIRSAKQPLSCRKAAKIYNVPEPTLRARIAGRPSRRDTKANCRKLTELEEQVVLQHIIDRDARGFSPRLADVEDMANHLLEARTGKRVGKLWAHRFVRRQPELKTRFTRVYDFQRALCEDPEVIGAWF
jgi:hypothetical protein